MTTTVIFAPPIVLQFFDSAGAPLVGGKIYTYQAGTTTPQTTYSDSAGSSALPNPIILNSRGEVATNTGTSVALWIPPATSYKFVLKDASDNTIWTEDNIQNSSSLPTAAQIGQALWPRTASETSASVTPSSYAYPPGDIRRYYAGGGDYSTAFSTALTGVGFVLVNEISYAIGSNVSGLASGPVVFNGGILNIATGKTVTFTGSNPLVNATASSFAGSGTIVNASVESGMLANTYAANSIAIGRSTKSYGQSSTGVGYFVTASGVSSLAIGNSADAESNQGIAIGNVAQAGSTTPSTTLSVQSNAASTTLSVVSAGSFYIGATILITLADGSKWNTTITNIVGTTITIPTGLPQIAPAGTAVSVCDSDTIAIGGATATSNGSIAIGGNALAAGVYVDASHSGAVAVGRAAKAGQQSVAVGENAATDRASGTTTTAVAIGSAAVVGANCPGSIVIGASSTANASASHAIVIGDGMQAPYTNQVQIGRPTFAEWMFGINAAEPADGHLQNGQLTFWLDETNFRVMWKMKTSGGTIKKSTGAGGWLQLA